MELQFKLPDSLRALLALQKGENVRYCVPYDLDFAGNWILDGYFVVTEQRLVVFREGKIVETIPLSALEKMKCQANVSNGCLIITEKTPERNYERMLIRFSMKHVSRMASVAWGAEVLSRGGNRQIISKEYEKTCPICGRGLSGSKSCPKCSGKPSIWKNFLMMCLNHKGLLLLFVLLMLTKALLSLTAPYVQQIWIDRHLRIGSGTVGELIAFAVISALIAVGTVICGFQLYRICARLGAVLCMDLRKKLYDHIQLLSMSSIQERQPGELINRVTNDTRTVRRFMEDACASSIQVLITMIGAIACMLSIHVPLTLLSVVFVPAAIALSMAFRKSIHRRFHRQWEKMDAMNNNLQDVLSGIRVVKSFGKEKAEAQHFDDVAKSFMITQRRNEVFWAVFFPLMTFAIGLGVYLVTFLGGEMVLIGGMTPGTLLRFITYATMLYGPLGWMTYLPRMVTQTATSLERIDDVLGEEPRIRNAEEAKHDRIEGNIEFRNVTFGYHPYEPVLEKISLSVKKGEMIGLVGASGTGKSTMINLIMRLYEVDDGELLIDGVNINDWNIENYHSQIGVVLQETFLFSGTIYENLRFAKPDATYEEIIRATKMANAHDFILKTPDGYNTYVGEHGHNLSGGERQRIAIARAILNDPRILILDEATSSLDTESEYLIQKALERLTKGRTTIAIAHRLSTLKDADRLVVLDGHHVAEIGTHNELIERRGIYHGLVTAQLEMQSLNRNGADAPKE